MEPPHLYIARESVVPMRRTPQESAEMVSQLIFGERCTRLDQQGNWTQVRLEADGYTGWADTQMLEAVSPAEYQQIDKSLFVLEGSLRMEDGSTLVLPVGARIPAGSPHTIRLGDLVYEIKPDARLIGIQSRVHLTDLARHFLNTPYLWGGRSGFGIDCSGLMQVVFSMCGVSLPRDSGPQSEVGKAVVWGEHQSGDLAFFGKDNPSRVSHVGLLVSETEIIHASGRVRIDRFTPDGIVQLRSGKLTHHLIRIRRC
ncbi:MAG: NlpC/P60 family protein [Bacteroidia bacterium]|nr:NlpC/P60 family protein [Bacteroidia bacterium]